MESVVYVLGVLTTLCCAVLLLRGYARSKKKLLLWSGLCFAVLTVNNMLLVIDLVVLPNEINLYRWRLGSGAIAMFLLLYGLIFESE